MTHHPVWNGACFSDIMKVETSGKWKRHGAFKSFSTLFKAISNPIKLFCDWSMLILQILWKKYRAKYDVASESQVEENVRNVRSVAIMCTWFKEKSANIVTVGNPKIHLYFVLNEFVPVMVSLVKVHNYVTFNKDTFLYLVMLILLCRTYRCCMCVVFICSLLLFYFLAYLLSKLCPFKSLGKVSSWW